MELNFPRRPRRRRLLVANFRHLIVTRSPCFHPANHPAMIITMNIVQILQCCEHWLVSPAEWMEHYSISRMSKLGKSHLLSRLLS